jgi:hypothetical protein
VTESVSASEPIRQPTLSPDPEQIWRPGPPTMMPPEEIGPIWRHFEAAKVVLALMALVVVIMGIMVMKLLTGG